MRKKDTGKIYAMKIIRKDTLKKGEEKSQDTFNRELNERKHLAGIINVEKAVYKHWLVQATKAERRVLEVKLAAATEAYCPSPAKGPTELMDGLWMRAGR